MKHALKSLVMTTVSCVVICIWMAIGQVLAEDGPVDTPEDQESFEDFIPPEREPHPVKNPDEGSGATPEIVNQNEADGGLTKQEQVTIRLWTFAMALAVLVFGLIVICLEIWVMIRSDKYWEAYSFKLVGLTIIITAGMFLILAGYTDDQLASMMGLLGTTIGYILGRDSGSDEGRDQERKRTRKART